MSMPFRALRTLLAVLALALVLPGNAPVLAGQYACGFTTGNPVLFVAATPMPEDFGTRIAAFGNHRGSPMQAPRGGDLYIRYPDGSLRNLTKQAGYGIPLENGEEDPANSIAVREPSVHWNGKRALFSMVVGGLKSQWDNTPFYWQIHEITGFCPGQTVQVTKLKQPENYNNVAPRYASDGNIIFVSDMPPQGPNARHLYPLLDEYEQSPITSGIWKLNIATGTARILSHSPSGAMSPLVDSYGRIIYTRWDHLKRNTSNGSQSTPQYDFASEAANAAIAPPGTFFKEVFPALQTTVLQEMLATGAVDQTFADTWGTLDFNQFFPWMIHQDGSNEETLNHVGRHELNGTYTEPSRKDDPRLDYFATRFAARPETATMTDAYGLHHLYEDPKHRGRYFGVITHEIGAKNAGQVVYLNGAPSKNAASMGYIFVTHPETRYPLSKGETPPAGLSGLYRNPMPLSDGTLWAVHTPPVPFTGESDDGANRDGTDATSVYTFRIRKLWKGADGYFQPGRFLTQGLSKQLTYWLGNGTKRSYSGLLWELEPIEVRPHTAPPATQAHVPDIEKALLAQKGITLENLRAWLVKNNLALAVIRNATVRDHSDRQQPYNLRVPGGVQTKTSDCTPQADCKLYDVTHLQFFVARYLRGHDWGYSPDKADFTPTAGRRVLPRPLSLAAYSNPKSRIGTLGSASKIAADGSVAVFVPAGRALSWQLINAAEPGDPVLGTDAVVRERYWVTFGKGEIRVCAACHGVNQTAQDDSTGEPKNTPQALSDLLTKWKQSTTGASAQ